MTSDSGFAWACEFVQQLMFIVPALAAGDYLLMVRAAFGKDDVRMGTLEATLTVA